jgi:nicotinate-nucleotide pyrophosphorylase
MQRCGKPDRRFVIRQRQQQAGGGDIQRLPAVLELLQRDNHARLAHGFQQATKTVLGILHR